MSAESARAREPLFEPAFVRALESLTLAGRRVPSGRAAGQWRSRAGGLDRMATPRATGVWRHDRPERSACGAVALPARLGTDRAHLGPVLADRLSAGHRRPARAPPGRASRPCACARRDGAAG